MIVNVRGLWHLSRKYRELRMLEGGITPADRGRVFNGFVADVLRAHGITAMDNIRRPHGEIDVAFTLNGTRFLLEAKWEKAKSDGGQLAKLDQRLRESLAGTRGVFLSMTGFTPDAVIGRSTGQQIAIVMIDVSHFEAMLAGLLTPAALFGAVLDHAAFVGIPNPTLLELLPASSCEPVFTHGAGPNCPSEVVERSAADLSGQFELAYIDGGQDGVHFDRFNGVVLVTTPGGIAEVFPDRSQARWRVPVRQCRRNAYHAADGWTYFIHEQGAARIRDNVVEAVAGGFAGSASLIEGPDGPPWAVDNGNAYDGNMPSTLIKLGDRVGDELRYTLNEVFPASSPGCAAWLMDDRFVVVSQGFASVVRVGEGGTQLLEKHAHDVGDPMGIFRDGEDAVVVAGGDVAIRRLRFGEHPGISQLANLRLIGSVVEISRVSDSEMLCWSNCAEPDGSINPAVVRLIGRRA